MLLQRLLPARSPPTSSALNLATLEDRNDINFVMRAVSLNGANLEYVSPRLRANGHVVLNALSNRGLALEFASLALRNDRKIVEAAVNNNGLALKFASSKMRKCKAVVLAAVLNNGLALEFASKAFKEDRDIVAAALQQNGYALHLFAAESLKNDYELNFMALKQNGECYSELPSELRDDRALALLALEQNGHALRYFSREFRGDREIVLAAVRVKGRALHHARRHLRADRDIVSAAVRQTWHALQYASSELRADPTLVIGECGDASGGRALQFADDLALDKEQALLAVQSSGRSFRQLSAKLRADRDVCLAAVRLDGEMIRYASSELRADKEVVLISVSKCGRALQWAPASLRTDHEVCLAACQHDGRALHVCAPAVRGHRDFSSNLCAARFDKELQGSLVAYYAKLKAADRAVVLAACTNYGLALAYASIPLQRDREIVLAAVRQNGRALQYAGGELRADKDVVAIAVAQPECGSMIRYASEELRKDRNIVITATNFDWDGEKCAADEFRNADKNLPTRRADRQFVSDVALAALSVQEVAPLRPRGHQTWRRPWTRPLKSCSKKGDVTASKKEHFVATKEWFPDIQPHDTPQESMDAFPDAQSIASTLETTSLDPSYEIQSTDETKPLGIKFASATADEVPNLVLSVEHIERPDQTQTQAVNLSTHDEFMGELSNDFEQYTGQISNNNVATSVAPIEVHETESPLRRGSSMIQSTSRFSSTKLAKAATTRASIEVSSKKLVKASDLEAVVEHSSTKVAQVSALKALIESSRTKVEEVTASKAPVEDGPKQRKHQPSAKPVTTESIKEVLDRPPSDKPHTQRKSLNAPARTAEHSESSVQTPVELSAAQADDLCQKLEKQIVEFMTERAPHNLLMTSEGCAFARRKFPGNPVLGLQGLLHRVQEKYGEGYSQSSRAHR